MAPDIEHKGELNVDEHDKRTTIGYWLLLTLAALLVRIVAAFFVFGAEPERSDPLAYADQARGMVAAADHATAYFWPPGRSFALVPFFLAFGTSASVVRANSIFFDVGCVLAAAAIAHQVLRRSSAARLSGWVAALYPPAVMLSAFSYSMNVVMFAMLCCAYFALLACRTFKSNGGFSLGAWFLSGGFLGFAVLTRPSSVSILLAGTAAWIGFLLVQRIRPGPVGVAARISSKMAASAGSVFLLGVACCIAPVVKHQLDLGAGWCVSTNNEATLFYGNNPYTPHYKTWHLGSKGGPPEYQAYLAVFSSQADPRSAMLREAWRYILARPDIFLLRTANRVRAFWGFDYIVSANIEVSRSVSGAVARLLCLGAEAGGYCVVMLLVILGLFLSRRAMTVGHAALLVGLALAYQAPYALVYACGSYRFPVMGFLFPFAGLALDEIWRGGGDFWRTVKGMRWFWISIGIFVLVQLEYAYFIFAYSNGLLA
jgi:hypothetical protein